VGRAAFVYVCFGLALIGIDLSVGGSLPAYQAAGMASAAAVVLGIAWYRPANRLGWAGIAVAQTLFALGDFAYYLQKSPPQPSVADAMYLASYAVFIPSLLLLMGRRFPWRDWAGHLDAVLISACLGLAGWMMALDGRIKLSWSASGIVSVAYPVADAIAIAVMIRVALLPGRRSLSFWLLFLSLLPLLVSDGSYVLPALSANYKLGGPLDIGWLGSYALVGAAALHPSMRRVMSVGRRQPQTSPVRGVLIAGFGLIALRLADRFNVLVRHQKDTGLLLAGSMVLVAAVLLRGLMFVRELDRARTRAEESERRFRMIFERAPIGISFGRDGIMSETNPALHRMLGYDAADFARMHFTEVTHPDDRELDHQAQLDTGRVDQFAIDKRYVKKDGSILYAHVKVALEPDTLGVSLIEDVTSRRELEDQLRQSQKMDAIGKLAGGIAHDFNNLMTAVLGYSDLLLNKLNGDDDGTREKVEGIRDAALRASDLTRQLLAFGRRQMFEMRDVDLRDVVLRSESLLRRLIGEDIRLDTVVASEPVIVHADPTQLDQVVINLAVNAREAMPNGGALTIVVAAEDGGAVLAVGDTGVGMDEATRARIFEPFFTTKPFGEGSGLGLSTVDGIVAQSGGTVAVASTEGSGTVFTIRLPLVSNLAKVELTDESINR
jgi:PAS domain S-box-containing protein